MKILILDMVKPLTSSNGCAVHRFELVNNLAKSGNEVHIFSMDNFDYSRFNNITCHRIYSNNLFLMYLHYALIFIHHNIFRKYEVVYTRNPNLGFLAGLFLTKINGSKLVYELNGIPEHERELKENNSIKNKTYKNAKSSFARYVNNIHTLTIKKYHFDKSGLREFIFKNALDHSSKIIAVTTGIKEYTHKNYEVNDKKIVVINNGANTNLFKPIDQKKSRSKLKLEASKNYICFVGNFVPWQGVEYLIQAAPIILKKCHADFLIVGDGDLKEKWMQLAQDLDVSNNVIFTGSVPYETVPLYINASDVCVAPFVIARNAKIGLSPLKAYEYLACGKPVVASNITGVSDLLQNSSGGIGVAPECPQELADAIIQLIQNEELRKQMGSNGRKYVVENHSWEMVAKNVSEICETVIEESKSTKNE